MFQMRAQDFGIRVGSLPKGPRNKITDVPGVLVGHATVDTPTHKTRVTVILPGPQNPFTHKLPAGVCPFNGFGKTAGLLQLQELGTLETPIALTNTLNVGLVHDAMVEYMLSRCEAEGVALRSVNPRCASATTPPSTTLRSGRWAGNMSFPHWPPPARTLPRATWAAARA